MTRLLGAVLLAGGCGWLGLSCGRALRERTELLRQLVYLLERMERELTFRLTPLPELFARLGEGQALPLRRFFYRCAQEAGAPDRVFHESWARAAGELSGVLEPEAVEYLSRLGQLIGRYDGQREGQTLSAAIRDLRDVLARSGEENRKRSRLYSLLGMTAGAFWVILLI